MKTLNSVHSRGMAAKMGGIGVLAIAAILLFSFAPFFSFAAGTTVTVQTTPSSFPNGVTGQQIPISGTVTPAPGASGYGVTIEVTNPSGLYFVASTAVNATTGAFSYTLVTGSPAGLWGNGTYTVTAIYATSASGPTYTGMTTFTYGEFVSSSSSTSSSGSASSSGVATTIVTSVVTTIVQQTTVQTTTVVSSATTVNLGTTIVSATTTTVQGAASTLAETLGVVGIVIAVIAGGIAAMALRKH
jgi:hypothetical protein